MIPAICMALGRIVSWSGCVGFTRLGTYTQSWIRAMRVRRAAQLCAHERARRGHVATPVRRKVTHSMRLGASRPLAQALPNLGALARLGTSHVR